MKQKSTIIKIVLSMLAPAAMIGSLHSPLSTPPARCAAGTSSQTGSRWSPLSSDTRKQQKNPTTRVGFLLLAPAA